MRRLSITFLAITMALSLASAAWAFQGSSSKSEAPAKTGTIFGIEPWEAGESVILKNAMAGITAVEISKDKAVFKDLIDREISMQPPEEVDYYFINERVYRMQLHFSGISSPYKLYANLFYRRYGQPVFADVGDYEEATWNTEEYILKLRSNFKKETRRQLENQVREAEKIIVTVDVIFTEKGN